MRKHIILPGICLLGMFLSGCSTPVASMQTVPEGQVRAAMTQYRRAHPVCESCGNPGSLPNLLNVHHKKPRCAYPELAAESTNFITLCRRCHIAYGHAGDGGCRVYLVNIDQVLASRIVATNAPCTNGTDCVRIMWPRGKGPIDTAVTQP
jgi:hypothetical protein